MIQDKKGYITNIYLSNSEIPAVYYWNFKGLMFREENYCIIEQIVCEYLVYGKVISKVRS